ncbi:MAG: hypothetical protein LBH48_08220 [Bifidobacteriaceae bacterium]|jgi:hypothetical protein|nr:hypothetical protein [Bifidobacteriaceae bacterium]
MSGRSSLFGLLVVTLALLGACQHTDDDVASVTEAGGQASSSGPAPELLIPQWDRAEAALACLTARDLPATLNYQDDGQAILGFDPPPGVYAHANPDGSGTSATDAESSRLFDEASSTASSLLWIGGADRTADLDACIAESGYTPPGPFVDQAAEQLAKQTQVDLDNDFVACARRNGYPDLPDSPPAQVDGGLTHAPPPIELPLTISDQDLRDLLDACPAIDEARIRELADGNDPASVPSGGFGPNIWFAVPGQDTTEGASDADWNRASELHEVLMRISIDQQRAIIDQLESEGIEYQGGVLQG